MRSPGLPSCWRSQSCCRPWKIQVCWWLFSYTELQSRTSFLLEIAKLLPPLENTGMLVAIFLHRVTVQDFLPVGDRKAAAAPGKYRYVGGYFLTQSYSPGNPSCWRSQSCCRLWKIQVCWWLFSYTELQSRTSFLLEIAKLLPPLENTGMLVAIFLHRVTVQDFLPLGDCKAAATSGKYRYVGGYFLTLSYSPGNPSTERS